LFSDSYFTISKPAEAALKEKGSKFLSFVFPVVSETEIKVLLTNLKKLHPGANHHCYAWRLGADKAAFRANDDGEPSNSAGKPILSQIQSNDLTNVLIVVVRYFGGTLLGVGGLIQAYKHAAAAALQNTEITECFILFEYKLVFNFEHINAVMRILKDEAAIISSTSYAELNTIIFSVKKQNSEKIERKFKELYTCQLNFLKAH
jgi:uncharacterized YigZ family protein